MKIRHIILLAASILMPAVANATVLTFDDVPGGSIQHKFGSLASGYKGFKFNHTLEWIDTLTPNRNQGAHSGAFTLMNNWEGPGIITAADNSDFTFDGLWAKKWGSGTLYGTLEGYNNNQLIWRTRTVLNGSFQHFAAQTAAIDSLKLNFGDYFLVDDICLNSSDCTPSASGNGNDVAEPAPLALLGLGLIGLGLMRRRKA